MKDHGQSQGWELAETAALLHRLEARVARLEARLGLDPEGAVTLKDEGEGVIRITETAVPQTEAGMSWESRIGEFWLAQVGTIVLFLGLAFLISYPFASFPPLSASFLGYLAVAGFFGLARYWKKNFLYLSRILFGGAMVLAYFATLRLHFFNTHPLIAEKAIGLAALVVVLTWDLYLAIKRKSQILAGIALSLCYLTSLFSGTTHFALTMIVAAVAISVFLLILYNWHSLALVSLVMAFITHLLWLFNSPVLGNPIHAIAEHHGNIAYLAVYGLLFGVANVFRKKESYSSFFDVAFAILNGFAIFFIGALNVLFFFRTQLSLLALITAVFFMTAAIINRGHDKKNYAISIYACFCFIALSVAIFAQFHSPDYFVWLGWQSLLVIITAIWFRSRIIVIANIAIYLAIYLAYLRLAPSYDLVNLSYAVSALLSARILNWKKERLTLKTDLIRNLYLTCAFIIILYGLKHAIPANYVSLSWLGAGLFYFAISALLSNIKYRWMAILTIFATVVHVFAIDLSRINPGFRIILFLAVGMVLVLLSLFYARYRRNLVKQA
jgi:hypothetical protein